MNKEGFFITLEGPDKTGKSTQAGFLVKHLEKLGFSVVWTREPGGTPFAEAIRAALLNPEHKVSAMAELLLYEASRAQHVGEKILPALKAGKIVVCERFTMSTLAYQGYGRGMPLSEIEKLNRLASGGLKPDLTFVFDMDDSEFSRRLSKKRSDRLELEPAEFRLRVQKGYRELAKKTGAVIVDAGKPASQVREYILAKLKPAVAHLK